jgi:hypothetical protein
MVISILNLIVLTFTLAAVVWYAVITRRMQQAVADQVREFVHQRQLDILPAFVASIQTRDSADYLELNNIGNGIAININIDPVEIRFPSLESRQIIFEKALMLGPRENTCLESKDIFKSGREYKANHLTFLRRQAHYNAVLNIRFQDIEGNKHIQTLKMGIDGYEHGFVRPYEGEE